jgi:Arm DNA-binding domain
LGLPFDAFSKFMISFYDYVGWKPACRGIQPDLIWDDEVRGLCLRIYGDGSKSFVFLYRIDGHQRFIRIGQSPVWSLKAARIRAQELRSIVDQGQDPRLTKYHENGETFLTQYITEHIHMVQLLLSVRGVNTMQR